MDVPRPPRLVNLFWIQKNDGISNGQTAALVARKLEEVLAARLRELASERDLPISHVADRCGLAHSYFWQLLHAEASASLAVVQRLADALGVDPLTLLSDFGGRSAPVERKRQPKRRGS